MSRNVERWSSNNSPKEVIQEFWAEFSASWATLNTVQWVELARVNRTDEEFLHTIEGLHYTALILNALIRSLTTYLTNHAPIAKDSALKPLIAFVHDLRAPLAAISSLSDSMVIRAFADEAQFVQWHDQMTDFLTRIDRVVVSYTGFFAQ